MPGTSVIVGGSGFLGRAVARQLDGVRRSCVTVDRRMPPSASVRNATHLVTDLLTDEVRLPDGDVIVVAGSSLPRVRHPWTLVLDNAVTAARLAPHLAGRRVVLASSVEVLGRGCTPGQSGGLPIDDDELDAWCTRALQLAVEACPPWRAAALCRELVRPGGRWTYASAKRAQELLLTRTLEPGNLRIVRLPNLFGLDQDRVVARLTHRALAGLPLDVADTTRCFLHVDDAGRDLALNREPGVHVLSGTPLSLVRLAELVSEAVGGTHEVRVHAAPEDDVDASTLVGLADTLPEPVEALEQSLRAFVRRLAHEVRPLDPPLPVVTPPRPDKPDVVADRQHQALWSGRIKAGHRWTTELAARLHQALGLGTDDALLLCASGSAALRLAVVAAVGTGTVGDVAVLPAFTFAATAEVLVQLGYRLRFVDVDPLTWTLDPDALAVALDAAPAKVVVAVDALGAPADYARLHEVCARHGVTLVADSAPALGALHQGVPVGSQTAAHAFSLSFAKVVSAGGAGGALALPARTVPLLREPVDWLRSCPLGELPAVVALDQIRRLEELVEARHEVAQVYAEFAAIRDDVVPQQVRPGDRHAYVHWAARITGADRTLVQQRLLDVGVQTKPYYWPALHTHDWGPHAEPAPDLPRTQTLDREALALPMSSEMTGEDAERVVAALVSALACGRGRTAASRSRQGPLAPSALAPASDVPSTTFAASG